VNATSASLAGGEFGELLDGFDGLVTELTEGHRVRKHGEAVQLLPGASLQVGPDQQRKATYLLQVGQPIARERPATIEEAQSSNWAIDQEFSNSGRVLFDRSHGRQVRADPHEQKLRDFVAQLGRRRTYLRGSMSRHGISSRRPKLGSRFQ
jgi:hypothetical protein